MTYWYRNICSGILVLNYLFVIIVIWSLDIEILWSKYGCWFCIGFMCMKSLFFHWFCMYFVHSDRQSGAAGWAYLGCLGWLAGWWLSGLAGWRGGGGVVAVGSCFRHFAGHPPVQPLNSLSYTARPPLEQALFGDIASSATKGSAWDVRCLNITQEQTGMCCICSQHKEIYEWLDMFYVWTCPDTANWHC